MDIISYNGNVSLTKRGKIFYLFFLRFLKENKCFYAYQRALLSKSYRPTKMEDFINLCNTWNTSIISNSFIWANTREGLKFWEHIDKKFKSLSYQLSLK